jgi:hypothetical protein
MAAQSGFNGSYLVVPPAGPRDYHDPHDMSGLYGPPNAQRTQQGTSVTPKEVWNAGGGGSRSLPAQQYPPRRGAPASPSMLASYATASAQPQLSSKFVGQSQPPQHMQQQSPSQSYAAGYGGQDYRPASREELTRYATAERTMYPGHSSSRAAPAPGPYPQGPQGPQSAYYGAPAAYPSQRNSAAYPSAPQQPNTSSYFGSQPLPPVQPDLIFQVRAHFLCAAVCIRDWM